MTTSWREQRIFASLMIFVGLACAFSARVAGATTISVSGGGTLTYTVTSTAEQCYILGGNYHTTPYTLWTFTSFTYSAGGQNYSWSSTATYNNSPGSGPGYASDCMTPGANPSPLALTYAGSTGSCTINFYAGYGGSGSASLSRCSVSGYINPKYIVLGVTYVPPGSKSYVEYCKNTSVSSTNSIISTFLSSFQQSTSTSVSSNFSILGFLSGSQTSTSSQNYSQSQSSKYTNTVSISQTTSLCSEMLGASNDYQPNNHDYDIIWVWLNPVVLLSFTESPSGTVTAIQWNGYGYNAHDEQAMEVYPAYVGCLNGDLKGCNLTPLSRTWDSDETWPTGQGPALTATDYANILKADPFSQCGPTTKPTNECSITPDPGRFTITDNQDISYFQPPVGAQPLTTIYSLTYSVAGTQSQGYTTSNSATFGVESNWKLSAFGAAISQTTSSSQTFTTTFEVDNSLTTTNGTSSTASVTEPACVVSGNACSPTYPSVSNPGPTEFLVYEDNLYGTFLFYPANWMN